MLLASPARHDPRCSEGFPSALLALAPLVRPSRGATALLCRAAAIAALATCQLALGAQPESPSDIRLAGFPSRLLGGPSAAFGATSVPRGTAGNPLVRTPSGTAEKPSAGGNITSITAVVGAPYVYARVPVQSEEAPPWVTATLRDAQGQLRARAEARAGATGHVELAFRTSTLGPQLPATLAPGDTLHLALRDEPDVAADIALPGLTATSAADEPRVLGTAPAGVALSVNARDQAGHYASATTTSAADGTWSAAFQATEIDWVPGTRGSAYFTEADTVFQANWEITDVRLPIGGSTLWVNALDGTIAAARVSGRGGGRTVVGDLSPAGEPAPVWLHDERGEAVAAAAGDSVEVQLGGEAPRTLAVPGLSASVVPEADWVTGVAPAGEALRVTAGDLTVAVTAAADGTWLADFATLLDLKAGTRVSVTAFSTPESSLTAYAPDLTFVDPFVARVRGRGSAGTATYLRVTGPDGALLGEVPGTVGPDGLFSLTAPGPLPLEPGSRVAVSIGDHTWDMPVRRPSIDVADAVDDRIAGRAPPGTHLLLTAGTATRSVAVGDDGAWEATFAPDADLRPGTEVSVDIDGPDGYLSQMRFPVFRASVQTAMPRVRVEGPPGGAASAELERDGDVIATGDCTVTVSTCEIDLIDAAGVGVDTAQGDSVLVFPEKGTTALIEVGTLSAHIDAAGRDVVGLAPAQGQVTIAFAYLGRGTPGTPGGVTAGTDSVGVFDHELTAGEWPLLRPGVVADVFYTFPDGHRMFSRAAVELARVWPGTPDVTGVAEPGSPVTATLRVAGREAGRANGVADPNGVYHLEMATDDLAAAPTRAGSIVEVRHRRGTDTLEVPVFAAWDDVSGGGTTGFGPSHVPVVTSYSVTETFDDQAEAGRAEGGARAPEVVRTGETRAEGTFYLPGPDISRHDLAAIETYLVLPGGGEVVVRPDPAGPTRIFLPATQAP